MSISSHENAIEPILHAEGLTQQVVSGERHLTILKDLNLAVLPGESLAILGQSGAGKSTLLGLLAGLDAPSAGRLAMFGQALNELDEDGRARLRAGRVGFVFQNFQLLPTLTALENVLMPLELTAVTDAESRARDWLTRVGLENASIICPSSYPAASSSASPWLGPSLRAPNWSSPTNPPATSIRRPASASSTPCSS
ncbi:ABC transporter ATP-binding protein YtrE [Halomonas elongata]|uniref:ABC transporter ATP-binding protein YtrE n=1 Tax=Halomonas elongata TaxID=2746 RepID=A0A1B8NWC9_HALEL|nr:ABC transporter ATP-binding protein YtrE [Halomonas elongata]